MPLGRGAEFYNCESCTAGDANGHSFSIADGQQLGRGPEFYNNMAVSIFSVSLSLSLSLSLSGGEQARRRSETSLQ